MSDRKVIMNMTGDQFKTLVEEKKPDELINTIPEILEFLSGIKENETLEQYIKRIVSSIFKIEDGNVLRIVLEENYEDYIDVESISDLPEDTRSASVILSSVVNEFGNDKPYFKDILVSDVEVDAMVTLKALEALTLDNVLIAGGKGPTNGKIITASRYLNLRNITAKDGTTLYNAFEGYQSTTDPKYTGLKKLVAENLNIDCPSLTHNIINVYTPANNAEIIVRNSKFNLTVDNSNILRMANYMNSENVTITFENVDWTYENGLSFNDWYWAGLVIYQPASSDKALIGNVSALATWKLKFKNCRYNGQKVTANNFGQHNQVFYLYNVNNTRLVSDPAAVEGLTIEFE